MKTQIYIFISYKQRPAPAVHGIYCPFKMMYGFTPGVY
jgi:hypothetical protein